MFATLTENILNFKNYCVVKELESKYYTQLKGTPLVYVMNRAIG